MIQQGSGVMIRALRGNATSAAVVQAALGKTIAALSLNSKDNALHFEFTDGSKMRLADEGQSCCERRYMRTDDALSDFVGSVLVRLEVKDGPDVRADETHNVQFLAVTTSKGVLTMVNHNEHNGYYGGFSLKAAAE